MIKKTILGLFIVCLLFTSLSANDVYYIGNKVSRKYHYSWCRWAKIITPKNIVYFKSAREAGEKGYIACKVCKPRG